jgi:hypothetical protein
MSAFTVDRRITGTGGAEVLDLQLLVDDKPLQDPEPVVDQGKEGVIELTVRVDQGEQAGVSVFVDDIAMSQVLAVTAKDQEGRPIVLGGGVHRLRIPLGKLEMNMGTYSILVGVKSFVSTLSLCRVQGLRPFRVRSQSVNWSKIVREQVSTILPA